jgi:glutamate-ammonia-ligase adenylyltransferase
MKRSVRQAAKKNRADAGVLAGQISTAPKLSSAAKARRRLKEFLADAAKNQAGEELHALVDASPNLRALLEGLADGSPYLWELASAEPERLLALLRADPERRLSDLLSATAGAVPGAQDEAAAMRALRRMRSEGALLIGLCDIGGVWTLDRITRALTQLADTAARAAVRFIIASAAANKKLRAIDESHPEKGCGLIVLAMGKMGAQELNYSSDVDLIVLFDPQAPALLAGVEPAPLYLRMTRSLVKLLQERTADGYVFRVDLRLRPDPASTQIAISTPAARNYYESMGQNWERAAMIKARPCAGDIAAGEAFLIEIVPFVWRKYLDFGAVGDVHAMKRQMHAYRGHEAIAVEGHNIKVGRGGIREIEFFVQTQQLIAGGRHPQLRGRETLAMLATLAAGGWIGVEAQRELGDAYVFLRGVEHRLQMVADEQTHTLPADPKELARFARFLGFKNRDDFAAALLPHLRNVQRHYARLFEDASALAARRHALSFPAEADDRETLDRLAEMRFRPLETSAAVRRWLSGSYRSLRGEAARGQLAELVPLLLDELSRAQKPDIAFAALDRFIADLHGGARLLSLLRQNPDVVGLLGLILGTAPRLADILARHPQVLDAIIDPAFFGPLPDETQLTAGLSESLSQAASYEDLLDRARLFGQEQMFLVGTRVLSGTLSAAQAGEAFARLADVVIRAVHRAVDTDFAAAHGRLHGQESAVLAMGKLGGREMTAASDLDLIVIYDFDADRPESDGRRPLYGGQYFARLTQRLVSALTAQTNYGSLYQVDMRLRPSGRSGPVATSLDSFARYQEQEAWTWEHLALTRARVASASSAFAARVEKVIRDVLCRARDPIDVARDVAEMRRSIATEKGEDDRWDLKYAAGGLIDLEFIAQYIQLIHAAEKPEILDTSTARVLDKAWRLGLLAPEDAELLRNAARLYHDLTQVLRLCLAERFDSKTAGAGLLDLMARAGDAPNFASLEAHLFETQDRVRASFRRLIHIE